MADFNKPTITGDAYVDVLGEIRAQFEVVSTMSYGDALNTKVGAIQYLDGSLQKWDGASFNVVPVSITGGGTGAGTAAGARAALGVNQTGTGSGQVRTNAQSDALYVPQARTISTSGALDGGGSLDSNLSLTIDDATTGQKGVTQLYDGINSTSTDLALTANQGRVLKDDIDALEDNVSSIEQLYNLSTSGNLSSGSCRVAKRGRLVSITGSYGHTSGTTKDSALGLLISPLWPSTSTVSSVYDFGKKVTVTDSGQLKFEYETAQSSTGDFCISYHAY